MTTDLRRLRCRVRTDEHGQRLDIYLPAALRARHDHELSRRAVRRALQAGSVYINGKRVRVASRAVQKGDRVEIVLESGPAGETKVAQATPAPPLASEQILFEDADLLVIDKAAGLPSQATQTDALGNALAQAGDYLKKKGRQGSYLTLPHRLDRGTSGALILVKSKRAAAAMARAFEHNRVHKTYHLISAVPDDPSRESWTIRQPLARDGRRMVPDFLGKEAETEVRVLRRSETVKGSFALLEASPQTGRKHQIRAHLAAEGFPILGDRLYSADPIDRMAPRPMLHARALEFEHPSHHEVVKIQCPTPEDFRLKLIELGLADADRLSDP